MSIKFGSNTILIKLAFASDFVCAIRKLIMNFVLYRTAYFRGVYLNYRFNTMD